MQPTVNNTKSPLVKTKQHNREHKQHEPTIKLTMNPRVSNMNTRATTILHIRPSSRSNKLQDNIALTSMPYTPT
eukprot:3509270-Prorocentrum_lima.AAC.1